MIPHDEPTQVEHFPFVYEGTIDIGEDQLAVVTAWDTNIYVRGLGEGKFSIVEQHGPSLEEGREYLLIIPRY